MQLVYKLLKNGYEIYETTDGNIYKDDTPWIIQDGFIPTRFKVRNADGTLNLEECAKAHIKDIEEVQKRIIEENQSEKTVKDTVENINDSMVSKEELEEVEARIMDMFIDMASGLGE